MGRGDKILENALLPGNSILSALWKYKQMWLGKEEVGEH